MSHSFLNNGADEIKKQTADFETARHITKCLNNNCKQAHITTTAERRPQQLLCNRRSLRRRVQNNFQWNYPFSLSHLLFSAVKKNNQTLVSQRKSIFVIT